MQITLAFRRTKLYEAPSDRLYLAIPRNLRAAHGRDVFLTGIRLAWHAASAEPCGAAMRVGSRSIDMEDWHFPRAYHLDAQAVDHMPRHPFDRTRSQIMNACREQAEARLRSYGAGDLLAAEPEIIPLTEEDDSPLGVPNFAFAWRDGAGGILVMPQRFSWELADIERRQRRNGSTRQGLIDAARPV